ncbi:uncharacterized protein BO66DRAFT_247810 [Aspergillus aculeatinus CBS 121060]|uniref:Uncharacterized protein n=1 Tax=Aspergillus aculeatinus CBS 121060 TaxID=1448322 RepID=A0ACD1GRU7_9EURO|nr:hypothetical protein BO66DRAFT_247810 [Aspergillus aculeatinus CBS 121060]RAH64089.1 hypothetical protein BO66DRAFT_247810 [Aspergillus aculeatinus CBS 121060]
MEGPGWQTENVLIAAILRLTISVLMVTPPIIVQLVKTTSSDRDGLTEGDCKNETTCFQAQQIVSETSRCCPTISSGLSDCSALQCPFYIDCVLFVIRDFISLCSQTVIMLLLTHQWGRESSGEGYVQGEEDGCFFGGPPAFVLCFFRSCSEGLRLDGGLESAYRASDSQGSGMSRHMGIRRRKMVRVASGVVSASIHVVSLMMFHVALRSI